MAHKKNVKPFAYDWEQADIKRERSIARELRDSQWWKRQLAKGHCYYCGRSTLPKELTMDHIVPVSRGGRSTKSNVVPCCKACNNAKKQLLPMEWEQYLKQFDRCDSWCQLHDLPPSATRRPVQGFQNNLKALPIYAIIGQVQGFWIQRLNPSEPQTLLWNYTKLEQRTEEYRTRNIEWWSLTSKPVNTVKRGWL